MLAPFLRVSGKSTGQPRWVHVRSDDSRHKPSSWEKQMRLVPQCSSRAWWVGWPSVVGANLWQARRRRHPEPSLSACESGYLPQYKPSSQTSDNRTHKRALCNNKWVSVRVWHSVSERLTIPNLIEPLIQTVPKPRPRDSPETRAPGGGSECPDWLTLLGRH